MAEKVQPSSQPSEATPSDSHPLNSSDRLDTALESRDSNVGLDQVLYTAEITLADLKDPILDIGSGSVDRFSREVGQLGYSVVSVDPKLMFSQRRDSVLSGEDKGINHSYPWQKKSVAGLMQELPLKSETFSTIFASATINYLYPADYSTAIAEIYRVLAPGGKAYILPLYEVEGMPYNEELFLKQLESSGVDYSIRTKTGSKSGEYKVVTITKLAAQ